MTTPTAPHGDGGELASGRPQFIADLVALYGEPRVKVETPVKRAGDEGHGRHWRRCWVWFLDVGKPELRNHNIHIDQYGNGRWELGIGCHCSCKQITIESRTAPTDGEALAALRQAGWLGFAPAAQEPLVSAALAWADDDYSRDSEMRLRAAVDAHRAGEGT